MRLGSFISVNTLAAIILLSVSVASAAEFRRTSLHVSNMQCGSCLRVIDSELRKVPGISGMTARFRQGLVIVDHEIDVTPQEISRVIVDLGYPVEVLASESVDQGSVKRFKRAGFGSGPGCCNPGGQSPVAESWRELRRRFFDRKGRQPPADLPE